MKKRPRSQTEDIGKRDLSRIAPDYYGFTNPFRELHHPSDTISFKSPVINTPIRQGDRRLIDEYLRSDGTLAKARLKTRSRWGRPMRLGSLRFAFDNPRGVMVCKRRKNRRRTLFAMSNRESKAGRGGGKRLLSRLGSQPKRYQESSNYSC